MPVINRRKRYVKTQTLWWIRLTQLQCDQGSPACARCTRLNIPCIGKGQLRYKFKAQNMVVAPAPASASSSTQSKAVATNRLAIWTPPHSPHNDITHLSDSFISVLQITDPKYDLTCFGDWFVGVPARLGSVEVLDKAADAFVAGLTGLRSGSQSVGSMVKYGKALTSLRSTLMDPKQASSPNTLCAIFMIMVCQGWYSRSEDGSFSHMEGIAHLLNASAGQDWDDSFDSTMRFNMIYPAVSFLFSLSVLATLDTTHYGHLFVCVDTNVVRRLKQ